jgi:hypothetical protein
MIYTLRGSSNLDNVTNARMEKFPIQQAIGGAIPLLLIANHIILLKAMQLVYEWRRGDHQRDLL